MNKAAERVGECRVLAARPLMTFASGPYRYRVERQASQSFYEVTDGKSTVRVPIAWCVGHGQAGQTWVFEKDGVLHESRVSYYTKIDGLDFTMGAPPGTPTSLSEAVGRPMGRDDVRGCFGCHTTFSSRGADIQMDKAIPGVTCEGCHGPGGEHAAALGRGNPKERGIFNPGQLATEAQSNFCGNCHRSWEQVMLAGSYFLNPWFAKVEMVRMTEIPIGHVGVVISYVGAEGVDTSGAEFKHGNIVSKGQKGVWAEPLGPGKYPVNPFILKVELVPTTNLVLNWASARSESHQLDKNLSTINVRSRDGFTFSLDVSQIIHIPTTEAPKVIARFGNMNNLVSQVLEPTIGNYFRNSAQDSDVIAFLGTRKERQLSAKEQIGKVLEQYNV
jgi:hypothetical protein